MSSENDVPLGEGARNYYEQQFGHRVRNVANPGVRPPASNTGGGNRGGTGWWGGGVGVVVVVIVIILRFVSAASRDHSKPSYNYQTPPQPRRDEKQKNDQIDDLLRKMREQNNKDGQRQFAPG
jgi:hypothetical protein